MNQRVMIAMAIACSPKLVIADEPTTALDVTIQAQILDLLLDLQRETGMALVLITHDMGVVAETAEQVAVLYSGQKVEEQAVGALFAEPHHPYTAALLAALPERAIGRRLPSIGGVVPGQFNRPRAVSFRRGANTQPPLRRGGPPRQSESLGFALCHYPLVEGKPLGHPGGIAAAAIVGVSEAALPIERTPRQGDIVLRADKLALDFKIRLGPSVGRDAAKPWRGRASRLRAGRTLAVVGESGSGKSTLARMVAMIEKPTSGRLLIDGIDVAGRFPGSAAATQERGPDRISGSLRLAQSAAEDRLDSGGAVEDQPAANGSRRTAGRGTRNDRPRWPKT